MDYFHNIKISFKSFDRLDSNKLKGEHTFF